ncbi:polarized growth protein-like protein Boi2 [Calycina marina]|uniref:Polarized growth protein-like protein Boi2 n=1 Tax=Calycina marina TaxID=1763456 RepID=A0A9P7Z3N3_9HELO|nr:polarized growth protein-like protein Boi2 [Calycina marina]
MASRLSSGPPSRPDQPRPELGQILIVIHEFVARSSDELSLSKGDRIELIERDDDFGDGWYLGRHLTSASSGLFPEVYTRIAPRVTPSYPPINSQPRPIPQVEPIATKNTQTPVPITTVIEPSPTTDSKLSSIQQDLDGTSQPIPLGTATEIDNTSNYSTSPARNEEPHNNNTSSISPPISVSAANPPLFSTLSLSSAAKSHGQGNDSPVMNETLSVIDEHITDMNSPQNSIATERRAPANDSGSEYSSHLDHRLSYINGEETDEEEEEAQSSYTKEEIMIWNADQVAEYLFTASVESKHCEVFRDQEITGDVLLGMDQTSVFLKEFDLGSVGRRLKTWQKIKSLQDEVRDATASRRNTATYGSEVGSEGTGKSRSHSDASTGIFPRIVGIGKAQESDSRQSSRLSQQKNTPATITRSDTVTSAKASPRATLESSQAPHEKTPSAASIRDMHHSRRSSVVEYTNNPFNAFAESISNMAMDFSPKNPMKTQDKHKKQPSFDRNWTMGAATPPGSTPLPSRPISSSGFASTGKGSIDPMKLSPIPGSSLNALDRGYFSGGEAEGKQRNVLRKRTISQSTHHSRNSSYTDEQRARSVTTHLRHSRFGSVDSVHASPPSASQKYYGLAVNGNSRRRTPSESSINAPPRPAPPPKDASSPVALSAVTKLDGPNPFDNAISPTPSFKSISQSTTLAPKPSSSSHRFGLRAISDAVTGGEKAKASPAERLSSPIRESPLQPQSTRTGSSTPSGEPSFDLESNDSKISMTPQPSNTRKKSKKETSAYTRGLEKKPPREQMVGADYSGWMKKKNTNLMTTWKPRLFVLKGRRLSYYYSESDEQEKGLIDISFHRVLPADTDRLTGLHATLTGATNTPTSPLAPFNETIAARQAAAEPESTLSAKGGDQMFIFKLVPPRAGLSRAVTFTKPTVHYFAVPNIKQGRLWMAALMKATIDRDDSKPITSTFQAKTISLAKARMMRHRPPALMNLDEHVDEEALKTTASEKNGLNIQGIIYDRDENEGDSGVSGVEKFDHAPLTDVKNPNSHSVFNESEEPTTA